MSMTENSGNGSMQKQGPRLLIICHDKVGVHMAGTGIRYWELARTLSTQQPVTLIAPHDIDLAPDTFTCGTFAWGNAESLKQWLGEADLVLANGHVLHGHPELEHISQPLALDLYDPTMLENRELFRNAPREQRQTHSEQDRLVLQRQLSAGDFFLCATERQRDLYMGALMASGQITPERTDADPHLRNLIAVVPSGLPAEPPTKQQPAMRGVIAGIGADDPLLLWTGGMWDWMDPVTLVNAMPQVVAQHPQARLVFLAGQHPGNAHQMQVPTQARTQAQAHGLLNTHIFFYEQWVPYQQRADFLLEATMAISLHREHLETRYAAIRSRILDHLWAGLPTIITQGDPASEVLGTAGAALVVAPDDSADVANAIIRLLANPDLHAAQSQAARELAQTYTWDKVVAPLAHFCLDGGWKTGDRGRETEDRRPGTGNGDRGTEDRRTKNEDRYSVSGLPSPVPGQPSTVRPKEDTLKACRDAALDVQEKTWRLHEQPVAGGKLQPLRRFLIDQIVRPFIMPLIQQQQDYNAAVLRSLYAINEIADQRRYDLEQQMVKIKENTRMTKQQLAESAEQLAGLEDADNQLMALVLKKAASDAKNNVELTENEV